MLYYYFPFFLVDFYWLDLLKMFEIQNERFLLKACPFCPDFRPRISSLLLFPLLLLADGPFAAECRTDEMSQAAR